MVDPADPLMGLQTRCDGCRNSQFGNLFWLGQHIAPLGLARVLLSTSIPESLSNGFRAIYHGG